MPARDPSGGGPERAVVDPCRTCVGNQSKARPPDTPHGGMTSQPKAERTVSRTSTCFEAGAFGASVQRGLA
jgi:hypothetical protein